MKPFALGALGSAIMAVSLGAVVRVTGSGMGCPDWPLCHGRIIPPLDELGAWIEWSHRFFVLIASVLVIVFSIKAYKLHKVSAYLAPLLVLSIQIILGAITVLTDVNQAAGLIHTIVAGLFVISLSYTAANCVSRTRLITISQFKSLTLSIALVFLTIVTGSIVTRSGASLASTEIPLVLTFSQDEITCKMQIIQQIHRVIAFLTFGMLMYHAHRAIKSKELRLFSILVISIVTLQISLGLLNIITRLSLSIRALHIVNAFVLLAFLGYGYGTVRRVKKEFPNTFANSPQQTP